MKMFFSTSKDLVYLHEFVMANPMIGEKVRKATPTEFPAVVSLMYSDHQTEEIEEDHFCTGALFTRSHVLTAAHCLEDTLKNETEIVVGTIDLRCGKLYFPLWWVDYNTWADFKNIKPEFRVNDIAVIKLTKSVPTSIPLLGLSDVPNNCLFGVNASIAGWGINAEGLTPRMMDTVFLTIISNSECEDRIEKCHGRRVPVHQRHLCSVADPYAIMQIGDSGGPIIHNGKILGVQKSTMPFAHVAFHPEKVNIHTSIIYYKNFVSDVLKSRKEWL